MKLACRKIAQPELNCGWERANAPEAKSAFYRRENRQKGRGKLQNRRKKKRLHAQRRYPLDGAVNYRIAANWDGKSLNRRPKISLFKI
jgi:hypothetical protein